MFLLSPKKIVGRIFAGYLCLFFFYLLFNSANFPPIHLAFIQLMMWVLGFILLLSMISTSRFNIFPIFIFQIVCISLLTIININVYNDPLGYDPHDALAYRGFGENYGDKPYSVFFVNLVFQLRNFDDWGFPSLIWVLYHFFGKSGWIVLLVLNAIVITIGCERLYKLSLSFVEERYARLTALFWGVMPFSVCTATGGLKENFFAFIVISVFYYLYSYQSSKNIRNGISLLLYILMLFFLRIATGVAMLACLIVVLMLRINLVRKNFKILTISGIIIVGLFLPIIFNRISSYRGVSYESVSASADKKAENSGGTTVFLMNAVSGFIGPFPNFVTKDQDKVQYITRYSFSAYFKMLISFFFLYSIWIIIRYSDFKLIPILLFVLMNILMVVFTFFALNMRFHWPQMPLFFLLSAWGYSDIIKRKTIFRRLYMSYLVVSLFIILLYNYR